MELPLTSRELTRQTRRRGMHASRAIVPGLVSLALCALLVFNPRVRPETVGLICFFVALAFQYGVLFLAAPLMTADLVAREKEERTLPLLLLANARNFDVVVSKYLSVALICELLLLGTMPLIAFAGFFGGVDVRVGAMLTLLNMATAAAFAALGMLASSMASQPRVALWLAFLFIAIHEGLSEASGLAFGYTSRFDYRQLESGTVDARALWLTTAPTFASLAVITAAALLLAAWRVSRAATENVGRPGWQARRRTRRRAPRGNAHALRVLAANSGPLRSGMQRVLLALSLAAVTVACYAMGSISLPILIAGIAYQTASNVRLLVRTGALDDLRLLPIDCWQLGDAVFYKHLSSALYMIPPFVAGAVAIGPDPAGQPILMVVKAGLAALLGFALMRYVVALTSVRATSSHPAVLAMFVLARLLVILVVVSIMSAVLYSALSIVVLWFRWIPLNAIPGPRAKAIIMYVLTFGALMKEAREPRLQFGRKLEMDLRYQEENASWGGGRQ